MFMFKGFDTNLCGNRGRFQFEVGQVYTETCVPMIGARGFHACAMLKDCFYYYPPEAGSRYALVELLGECDAWCDQVCTTRIRIVQEIHVESEYNKYMTGTFQRFNGDMFTYVNGKLQSIDDNPAVIRSGGIVRVWYDEDKIHRDGDLPAYVDDEIGSWWYRHGKQHRDHLLPAVVHADGSKEWFVNDVCVKY